MHSFVPATLHLLGLGLLVTCVPIRCSRPSQDGEDDSFAAGVAAFTEATRAWRAERECVSCHTNGWGLAAHPVIAPGSEEALAGRRFARSYLRESIEEGEPSGQYGSVEGLVATTAFLAMSDARSGHGPDEVTHLGLDHAWGLLDESGTWEGWLQCNWPPFESDAEFGPTLMLVALGELRAAGELRAVDRRAARRLESYLRQTPPLSLHDKAMRLWAGTSWPGALLAKERGAWRKELVNAQASDGGWSMAALSGPRWKRDGGEEQTTTSEAYPTAFSVYVLLRTGATPSDPVVDEGLRWLREHQREEGDWFTRSPRRDGKHYISRAATAFALMALAERE